MAPHSVGGDKEELIIINYIQYPGILYLDNFILFSNITFLILFVAKKHNFPHILHVYLNRG